MPKNKRVALPLCLLLAAGCQSTPAPTVNRIRWSEDCMLVSRRMQATAPTAESATSELWELAAELDGNYLRMSPTKSITVYCGPPRRSTVTLTADIWQCPQRE